MKDLIKQWIEDNQDILLNASKLIVKLRNLEVDSNNADDFMETIDSGIYVAKKAPYLLTAYDDECRLKSNPNIQIIGIAYTPKGTEQMIHVK